MSEETTAYPILRRLFTPQLGELIDCSLPANLQVINALRIAQSAVNEAIKEGADYVELRYVNIPDIDRNPDGAIGGVRVVGFRTVIPETENNQQNNEQ